MEHTETVIEKKSIYEGRVFSVEKLKVRLEDGRPTKREILHHSGGVCIFALTPDAQIPMVRQFRIATGRALWELPAGKLERGEDPLLAAKRELREECGLTASSWRRLAAVYTSPGYSDERLYLYLAEGTQQGEQDLDPGEFLDLAFFTLDELLDKIAREELEDAKSLAAILLARACLRGEVPGPDTDRPTRSASVTNSPDSGDQRRRERT